jgi:hypothetical protein
LSNDDNQNQSRKKIIERWHAKASDMAQAFYTVGIAVGAVKYYGDEFNQNVKTLSKKIKVAVSNGTLRVFHKLSGQYIEPSNKAYEIGIVDFQDFCNWGQENIRGCPVSASYLAEKLDMPNVAYQSEDGNWVSKREDIATEKNAPSDTPAELPPTVNTKENCLSYTKESLIKELKVYWETIESDIKDASKNGLSKAAKAGKRGWDKEKAISWAIAKGKYSDPMRHLTSSIFNAPTSVTNKIR